MDLLIFDGRGAAQMMQFQRYLGIAALFVLTAQLSAPAQAVDSLDPATKSRIDRIAIQVLEQTGVPSASVAVVKGGKLAYAHAYGKARLATGTAPAVAATPE